MQLYNCNTLFKLSLYENARIHFSLTQHEDSKFVKITEDNPPKGCIDTLRTSLGMSMRQLGQIANIAPQSLMDIEFLEKEGNNMIAALDILGKHLNMKLVYGFGPLEGSLQKKIDNQALVIAKKIISRTSNRMTLED